MGFGFPTSFLSMLLYFNTAEPEMRMRMLWNHLDATGTAFSPWFLGCREPNQHCCSSIQGSSSASLSFMVSMLNRFKMRRSRYFPDNITEMIEINVDFGGNFARELTYTPGQTGARLCRWLHFRQGKGFLQNSV